MHNFSQEDALEFEFSFMTLAYVTEPKKSNTARAQREIWELALEHWQFYGSLHGHEGK